VSGLTEGLETKLPSGWHQAELQDVAELLRGVTYTKDQAGTGPSDGRVPLLRATNIGPELTFDGLVWVDAGAVKPGQMLRQNDIVIAASSGSLSVVGKAAQLRQEWRGTFGAFCATVRPGPEIDPRFLALHFASPAYRRRVTQLAAGSNINNLKREHLLTMPLAVPPRDEQERIVKTVEALTIQIDDAAGNLRRSLDSVAALCQSILARPFAGDYPRARVSDVGDVVLGFTPSRKSPELWDGGIPWVSSGEVAFHRIDATRETIARSALGRRELNPPGTVLVAMYGEGKTRGQAAILGMEAVTNQAVAAIRLDPDKMLPEFLYQCLMHEYSAIRAVAQGGQQPNLNGEMVRSIEIPLPSITDQRAFVEAAERQMAGADQMESSLRRSLANAEVLRAAILRDAMAGNLMQEPYV
jgi:type I restriction enzyme S subunit